MTSSTERGQPKNPSPSRSDREIVAELKELLQKKPLQLLDYWNIGEQLKNLKDSLAEATGGLRGAFRRKILALKLGVSESTLNKCLQFRRSFRATHLARLRRLKVPWTQLSSSFGYSDAEKRIELLNKAKDEEWNVRELQREIQRINGRRRGGGRKRKEPKSRGLLADVVELRRLSEIWNGYYEKVARKSLDGRARGIEADVLRNQLDRTSNELAQLQEAVAKTIEAIGTLSKREAMRRRRSG